MSEKHVYQVLEANTLLLKSNPPILVVSAAGACRTGGWTDPKLLQRFYPSFPQDGIQDFDFVANPPVGAAADAITPVIATIEISDFPMELKGIRIHAEEGSIERLLTEPNQVQFPL